MQQIRINVLISQAPATRVAIHFSFGTVMGNRVSIGAMTRPSRPFMHQTVKAMPTSAWTSMVEARRMVPQLTSGAASTARRINSGSLLVQVHLQVHLRLRHLPHHHLRHLRHQVEDTTVCHPAKATSRTLTWAAPRSVRHRATATLAPPTCLLAQVRSPPAQTILRQTVGYVFSSAHRTQSAPQVLPAQMESVVIQSLWWSKFWQATPKRQPDFDALVSKT